MLLDRLNHLTFRWDSNLDLKLKLDMNYRFVVFLCGFGCIVASSQSQDSTIFSLPPITVESTRQLETYPTATRSIFVRTHNFLTSEPGLSLQHTLQGIPGIQINERGHFALGERVLVRGMGYRAAFGVRGLQAFLNGVPLTMSDGQSMLDVVDPVFIGQSELLRGPSSLFWGNASGGVLHLKSIEDTSPLRLRYMAGSYGLRHALLSSSFRIGSEQINVYASRVRKTGYRAHSKGSFLRAGLSAKTTPSPKTAILFTFNSAFQDVLSPGSLTLEQMIGDPQQADTRNVRLSAGKKSTHLQTGVTFHSQWSFADLSATIYGIRRSLENPLSFAWIDLDRFSGGLYAQLQMGLGRSVDLTTGIDIRQMRDHRIRLNNDAGNPGDRTLLNQHEHVGSIALFTGMTTRFLSRFGLSGGVRLDRLNFKMTDQFLTNGDQSGSRNFLAVSPSIGMFYRSSTLTWYTNLGTAFETPTTTELINSPTGHGGFNTDLAPQQTLGIEAGVRGQIEPVDLELDFSIYSLHIEDRLLPEQSEDGRTWYRNGGKNRHRGLEIAIEWPVNSPINIQAMYTYGNFIFLNDPSNGLKIPGSPSHQLHFTLHGSTSSNLSAQVVIESATKMWGNNTNSVESDGFLVIDLYLARPEWQVGSLTLHPFLRIQNIFDHQYVRSLVVNAFGGRYFEPAEGRSIQSGLGISL